VRWVVGIDEDGYREHFGLGTGSAESLEAWGGVFRDGLRGVWAAPTREEAEGRLQRLASTGSQAGVEPG
jgi:hypothetical protein